MNLIPLGVAMHHLLQSPVMADLFNTLKKQCLDQIGHNIKQIDKQIGTYHSIDFIQNHKTSTSSHSMAGSMASASMSMKQSHHQQQQYEQIPKHMLNSSHQTPQKMQSQQQMTAAEFAQYQ